MIADWAAFPIKINDRGVAVLERYHGHLVCRHADGRICEFAQTVLGLNRIGEQISKKKGIFGSSVDGLARPMSATGLHDTLGDSAG
jgi:hypothetical protein